MSNVIIYSGTISEIKLYRNDYCKTYKVSLIIKIKPNMLL